jgi:hypothetical protein
VSGVRAIAATHDFARWFYSSVESYFGFVPIADLCVEYQNELLRRNTNASKRPIAVVQGTDASTAGVEGIADCDGRNNNRSLCLIPRETIRLLLPNSLWSKG